MSKFAKYCPLVERTSMVIRIPLSDIIYRSYTIMKKILLTSVLAALAATPVFAAKFNSEKSIAVNNVTRKYVLYVPDNVTETPALVFSLHGAGGHDTDRSPFRTEVADSKGCIVVYPQGLNQNFGPFGTVPGWDSTGAPNIDLDFFKAIIEDVANLYDIDRNRIYCCGFSNGGMMTYSNATTASDIFAAFASISGFQLNEFHHRPTGARPTPFLHIHGKADDFVKYSCMPVIRDNMIARNGCNPVAVVEVVDGKYRKSVYEAQDGGFPYVYYEMDGMWHADFTANTEDGNSALTMWNFMSQYHLDDPCDKTLKWRINIDADGFKPKQHHWKVSSDKTQFTYGTPKKENNADNNVYSSLQFEAGDYVLRFNSEGAAGNKMHVKVETLDGNSTLFSIAGKVGKNVVFPFSVPEYTEYKITIVKDAAADKFTAFAFHSCAEPVDAENCEQDNGQSPDPQPEEGELIEIPQSQGAELDDFTRTAFTAGDNYNTYTATGDLQIAFKMINIDVEDCDYVLIKFAEPVQQGWHVAFWADQTLVEVPAGTSEYKFELEPDMVSSGILPQICMMTFFGGFTSPLVAKVKGVYKHSTAQSSTAAIDFSNGKETYYSIDGCEYSSARSGLNIVKSNDGKARKLFLKRQ